MPFFYIIIARFYATEAPVASDALRLTFVVPHKVNVELSGQQLIFDIYPVSWFIYRPFTRPVMFNKLTWLPPLVTWVSLLTMFLLSNNWTLVLLRLLRVLKSPRSSLVRYFENKKYPLLISYFITVSGGFATINPDNSLNINAVEASPLEEFSLEVKKDILERECVCVLILFFVFIACPSRSCWSSTCCFQRRYR